MGDRRKARGARIAGRPGSRRGGKAQGPPPTQAEILARATELRVLVVGDLMVDRYVGGDIQRVSPEAPVPILSKAEERLVLGGAANVAHNLVRLGVRVECVGVLGRDAAGAHAREDLRRLGVNIAGVFLESGRPTSLKTRVVARRQQILRIDHEKAEPIGGKVERRIAERLAARVSRVDAVIVSDYEKGVLTRKVLRAVLDAAGRADIPVMVGPKGKDFTKYRGATAIVPNELEVETASGVDVREKGGLRRAAERIAAQTGARAVVITRGGEGALIFEPPSRLTAVRAESAEVFDVTGAGDTFLSTLAVACAAGASFERAAGLANVAAGIVVGRVGAATVSSEELEHALERRGPGAGKVVSLEVLCARLAGARRGGQRVVFTNGCFDLLHAGHIHLLREARRYGDLLVLGLNDDASVHRLKGLGRPLLPAPERAQVLAALDCVDYVVIFGEGTPRGLIQRIRPDVLVKGATYAPEDVVGHEIVEKYGGKVEVIPLLEGAARISEILARATRSVLHRTPPAKAK
jgi:D-beta-D-heptose 7-phosphate kinase/D-beta-D-heptose 1-phosphate adenosyltransferase